MIKITLHPKSVTISGKLVHLINVDPACFVSTNLKGKKIIAINYYYYYTSVYIFYIKLNADKITIFT